MHRALHGAIMGLLIGGSATILAYQVLQTAANRGSGVIWLFILGFTAWGAILGSILPKHR